MSKIHPTDMQELIKMTGLTQAAIAEYLGIREAAVSMCLQGRSRSMRVFEFVDQVAGVEPGTTAALAAARATERALRTQAIIDAKLSSIGQPILRTDDPAPVYKVKKEQES